jgi:multidrug efflux pump subunit AcrA (membrane-fusion protein)
MKKALAIGIALIVIVAVLLVLFWNGAFGSAPSVRVVGVQMESLQSSVSTNGKIEARKSFQLHAPVSGSCRNILMHEGDEVKAGQAILTIDTPSLPPELAAARSELENAQLDLRNIQRGPTAEELNQAEAGINRYKLELENAGKTLQTNEWLLQRNAISKDEVEQSRRQISLLEQALDAAVAHRDGIKQRYDEKDHRRASLRVEAAEAQIRFLEEKARSLLLRAPISGTLLSFGLKDGAFVNAGDLIGVVADLHQLQVRVFVDEPDLGRVAKSAQAILTWDARSQESWQGTVRSIPPEVVAYGNRTVGEVLCDVEDPSGTLIPNVNVDVQILEGQNQAVPSLPREAVFQDGKSFYVWLMSQSRAEKRIVKTGRSTISRIEVTGGISRGEMVIIPGDTPMTTGMKVQVAGK